MLVDEAPAEIPISVTVVPQQLMDIFISNMPERTSYTSGELFNRAGMVVSGFYNNGQIQPVGGCNIDPDRPLTEADTAIVITSMDKTTIVPIRVSGVFRAEDQNPTGIDGPAEWQRPESADPISPGISIEGDAPLYSEEAAEGTAKRKSALAWASRLLYPSSLKLREFRDE